MKQKTTKPIPLLMNGIMKTMLVINLVITSFLISTVNVNAVDLKGSTGSVLQQLTVTGTIKDQNGQTMPGVNIQVEGTTVGSISDANGKYSISVPNANAVLVFTFVGYQELKVPIEGKSRVDVTMAPSTESLEEVVVIGYGTQKKKDVTSAISIVNVNDIAKSPVSNVTNALVGVTAGVEVQSNQGQPGTMASVRIRGVGSTNTTDPLWVVDGIPSDASAVNMQDVESIQILKDAASCAIYGSRGANGVIIVTTKGGTKGAPKVSYSGYYGWESPWKTIDLLNIKQWAAMVSENNIAGGTTPPDLAVSIMASGYTGQETDWQAELFQTGGITEHNLNISGGTDAGNYYFSVNQFSQDGIILDTKYKRYSVRMNSDWQRNKFKFGENLSFNYSDNEEADANGGRAPIEETIKITTNIAVRNPLVQGGFSGYDTKLVGHDASNPIGSLLRATNMNYNKRFMGNAYLDYEILKGLSFRTTFGLTSTEYQNRNLTLQTDMAPKNYANTTLSESASWTYYWVWENQLTYNKIFGNHNLTAMAAYTSEYSKYHNMGASGNTLQTETNDVLSMLEAGKNISGGESENSRISYLGRVLYTFRGKYMLTANFRRDGSSKFGPGLKWGNFPSASLAWRVSDESFMKGIQQISNLKLRTSYGIVGNDAPVGSYTYLSGLSSGLDYVFNGTKYSGVSVTGFNNPSLSWETVKQFDVALELGLFKGLVETTLEYFDKRTVDMIVGVPLPPSSGSSGSINKNVGTILNRGFEFSATVRKNIGDLDFSVTGNFTTLHNEVLDLGEGKPWDAGGVEGGSSTRIEAGHQIGAFYGYKMLDVFNDQAEIDAYTWKNPTTNVISKIQPAALPGDIKWADLNNDGTISASDRYFMGKPIPTFTYSLSANLAYRGFDLSLFFQGVTGNDIYAELVMWTEGMHNNFNCGTAALDRWTSTNKDSNIPRAVRNDPNGNITKISDRYLKDGSYTRLKNASLGYTLPKKVTDLVKLSNLRVYVTGRNLLTFTKYPFYDPEIGSGAIGAGGSYNTSRGIDNGYYPQARTVIMGIQVDF